MGQPTYKASNVWVHKPRIASFKKSPKTNNLLPVNKRAKQAIAPRRSVQAHELLQLQGYHNVKVYNSVGALKPISF